MSKKEYIIKVRKLMTLTGNKHIEAAIVCDNKNLIWSELEYRGIDIENVLKFKLPDTVWMSNIDIAKITGYNIEMLDEIKSENIAEKIKYIIKKACSKIDKICEYEEEEGSASFSF